MGADPARITLAWQLLDQLGVSLADLATISHPRPVPTVAEYLPQVAAAASPGTRRAYGSAWAAMYTAWGPRPLTAVSATDVEALQRQVTARARPRRNSRQGRHAGEHLIAAARAVYRRAAADGLIDLADSPAHRVTKPRRLPNTRRALTAAELEEINRVARSTGTDTVLDALLLRLHTETACRRGGALALRLCDLDSHLSAVRLHEKGGTLRWQPVTPTLAAALKAHAATRGAVAPGEALLRHRDGSRLTARRYDHLWHRIGQRLPWVAVHGITAHWLRHTTLTWVERHFGYATARAYAGHTDSTGPATTTYIKAQLHEVANALAAMTGTPHPLATNPGPVIGAGGDVDAGSHHLKHPL